VKRQGGSHSQGSLQARPVVVLSQPTQAMYL